MNRTTSRIMIVISAALWGVIGLIYDRLSLLGFSAAEIVLLRVLCAAVFMTLYIFIKDKSLFVVRIKDLWMFVGSGMISLACFNICYFQAMNYMDLSVAATLLYTAPIFVMIFSAVLFHERFSLLRLLTVMTTFLGCLFVTGAIGGRPPSIAGILFGIGSGIGYALYTIFGTIALKRYKTETITFYTFWFAVVAMLPFCNGSSMLQNIAQAPSSVGLLTLAIGIGCCLLPYLLYTKGLCRTPPSEASIIATLEPVVAAVVGVLFLDDHWSWMTVAGMILIIGSIIAVNFSSYKKSTDR